MSVHGLWLAEMIAAGHARALREERDRRASAATPSGTDARTLRREPAAGRASMRGPDSRVSRPTKNALGAEHPRRGAAERDDERRREVGVRVAAHAVGAEPQHARAGRLPLGVLRRLAGLLEAVLAALLLARVAREQPGLLQRGPRVGVERDQRTGDAEPDRAGLAADAAAVERRVDVVDLFGLREPQRLLGDDLVREDREVRRERRGRSP